MGPRLAALRTSARAPLRRFGLAAALVCAGAAWLCAAPAWAQPKVRATARPAATAPPRPTVVLSAAGELDLSQQGGPSRESQGQPSLRTVLGLSRASDLLASPTLQNRLRGIERLGSIGTSEAVDLLVAVLGAGSAGRLEPQTRLAAVRALAPHAAGREARAALASVLATAQAGAPELPLDVLARATAAMALAASGEREALATLVAAVIQGGRTGTLARQALLAYPPASLKALLGEGKSVSPEMVSLLGELGDLRAIPILRRQLDSHKEPSQRRLGALALAALGDGSVEPLARAQADGQAGPKAKPASDNERLAGAEVLLVLGARGAAESLAKRLAADATRPGALELAARAPLPELVPALRALLEAPKSTPSERERAAQVVARIGSDEAAGALLRLLGRPELATLGAFALGRSPSAAAKAGLEQALARAARGAPQRLVLRAGIVRFVQRHERLDGLEAALAAAFESKDPADRAVASLGLGLLGTRPLGQLLGSADRSVVLGAAGAALALGADALRLCAPRVRAAAERSEQTEPAAPGPAETLPLEVVACGASLLVDGAPGISSTVLARWAEAGGPLAPLAAMALAARDPAPLRGRLRALLAGTDPVVRAHVAFGLGRSPEPDAVSLLAEAYRFESEVGARRALLRALSMRTEPERLAILRLARDLDPDAEARSLGRSALGGHDLGPRLPPSGPETLWLSLVPLHDADTARSAERAARVVRADGLALPAVAAADGVLLLPGLDRVGDLSLQLAPAALPGDASP